MSELARTNYSNIPDASKVAINSIINNDEGSYVLSSDKDGGDGGWTYAGVTSNTWANYDSTPIITKEQFSTLLEATTVNINNKVVEIYYNNYLEEFAEALGIVSDEIFNYELSAAINCGVAGAVSIYKFAEADIFSPSEEGRSRFCKHWLLHYAEIVKAKPEKLQFLSGWINRVFRYL